MSGNGNADFGGRLTRLEEFVEVLTNEHMQFAEEHKRLLTAQVVLTDRVDKLAARMEEGFARTEERFRKLADAQSQTEERLGVLMRMMDDWIKRQIQ